jgi:molybdopterin converting factor small subunit
VKVQVRLHATLRRQTAEGLQNRVTVELPEAATVAALIEALDIELDADSLMVLIGQRRVYAEHRLNDGDEVQLFPPISGGV